MINSRSASVVLSSAKTRSSGSLETFVRNICQHYLSELIVRNICQNWLSEIFVRIICEKNVVHYNFQTKLWKCWGWPVSMLWSFCMVRVLFICSLESRTPFESSRVKEEKMRTRSVSEQPLLSLTVGLGRSKFLSSHLPCRSTPRTQSAPSPASAAPSRPWNPPETPLSPSPSQTPCKAPTSKIGHISDRHLGGWKQHHFVSVTHK